MMFSSRREINLILWIFVSANYAYDDSSGLSSESNESDYSKSSEEDNSGEGYSFSSHGSSSSSSKSGSSERSPGHKYNYVTRHTSSLGGGPSYGFEYASDFDSYLPLEVELDIDLDLNDLDYDTDLDYDSYFDYDLDYDPDLDPDFFKYKYRLYGLNHYNSHGSLYDELKFRNRFKKFNRRPYFRKLGGGRGYRRLNKFGRRPSSSSNFKHRKLDLDFDDDWGLGLGKYGLQFDYDKYSVGHDNTPISYVKFRKF